MESTRKHLDKLRKQIDLRLGKGSADSILYGIAALPDDAPPSEVAAWAVQLSTVLEDAIPGADLIPIREECACIKANKYSTYNKQYFPALRAEHPEDDEAYLAAVASFLNGRGRIGKKVEYKDSKIVAAFGFGQSCVCTVIRGGWEKPPSATWCRCCQGTVKSILQFIFPDRECDMELVETFATGGSDCIFAARFGDKK